MDEQHITIVSGGRLNAGELGFGGTTPPPLTLDVSCQFLKEMVMRILQLFLILLIMLPQLLHSQNKNEYSWEYFGQNPPGLEPELFAPGIISEGGRIHCFPTFSSNNDEVYWMILPPKILFSKYENNKWTKPEVPTFSKEIFCLRPFISYDNQKIYFASNLPDGYGNLDIWYIEKTDTGFSKPKNIGTPVNTDKFEAQQTIAENGNIYYTGYVEGKRWSRGIICSRYENGRYKNPEIFGEPINIIDTNAVDYTPFISKDESFLLFCSNRHNITLEDCRIYICFKDSKDNWGEPININNIMGFDFDSRDPYVSPDQKYLFFSCGGNIYWVSTKIIDNIKID
ncbi:MAG: hypothetical protein ACFFFT_19940 [Candidatus Thorarchaeota archaeon]